jgi:serine/threonine protein kinase/formylglycine-generating enzyme required for sulfatase activity
MLRTNAEDPLRSTDQDPITVSLGDGGLLFGRMALHTGFIDQETLDNAINQQRTDKAKSLADILVQCGSISEEDRRAIDHLCQRHVARHGDDPQQSLDSLTMGRTVSYRQPPGTDTVTYSQKSADGKQSEGTFGDYELVREIGRGGMGRVLAAHDRTLDREVALKVLQPGANADRFMRESKITARLPHPGIPPVYALGTLADGSPFLAMKLIFGQTLAAELKTADRPRLLQVFTQVCQAVGFAHSRRIIHRDLKPANIMVGAFGEVQVMGWGLAKDLTSQDMPSASRSSEVPSVPIVGTEPNRTTDHHASGESTDDRTQAGTVMGTPSYMAPEQARGEATDARADVFALGGILCAILTGQPPFTGRFSLEVIQRAAAANLAEALARLDGCGADAELVSLCRHCLSPNPVDRPADGQAVADGLTAYLNGMQERLQAAERERAVSLAKATEERKRRRVVAALSAVVVIILVVGSLVAVEMRNAARATGLVGSLASADVAQVPQIVAELEGYRRRATPSLEALAGAEPKTVDERRVQLHARLALVTHNEQHVHPLVEELLAGHVLYTGVIRDQLAPYQQEFQGELWEMLHDGTKDPSCRFRAGLALATYATTSPHWTADDNTFLVEQLVAANPEHQPRIREYLRPLDNRLLGEIERIFAEPKATESHQLAAANALADFAGKDAVLLARLLSAATPGQYEILYPLVAEARDAGESLNQLVREVPAADLAQIEKVALGQRRAGAAITLLRQGERESILHVLRVQDDPESLTQFVHRCRQRGILPAQLLECLKLADQLRQPKTGEARGIEDRVLYALLLALGEFELADLPEAQRDAFVEQLANWYVGDPSSAIHGATGWLLRHWKHDELAKKVDQTPVPYAPDREWYTLKFVVPQFVVPPLNEAGPLEGRTTFTITFVFFPAGEYLIGSPPDEVDRQVNERRHPVKLTRPIAVSDREITWEQYNSFDHRDHHDSWEEQFGHTLTPEEPAFGVNWYEAVGYCRWLTKCAGMAEGDQAYGDSSTLDHERFPTDPDPRAGGAPRNWPLNLEQPGFRLPTEAEWETVCRGGTDTAYSFGNDAQLLRHYGWFLENSEKWSHVVGRLRPNARGLFDIHGNLYEWCHDWYADYGDDAADRVYRGAGWSVGSADCRVAYRGGFQPTFRPSNFGFRVAAVPFSPASESVSPAVSGSGAAE